jgi:hypothetical protein
MSISRLFTSLVVLATLNACGLQQAEEPEADVEPSAALSAQAACVAYLFDQPNFVVPLNPATVTGPNFTCINLPSTADGLLTSFRLTCRTRFYDGPSCTGAVYTALTSGNMPAFMDNRTTSIMFTP